MFRKYILIALVFLFSCNNNSECTSYFSYDEVEHYCFDISEEDVMEIDGKEKKSDKEMKQLELLFQYTPDTLSDTTILKGIDKIGYVKKNIPSNEFKQLDKIFCERKHINSMYTMCIAIYRDILIFRRNNRIVGVAKICFGCNRANIIGTNCNTEEFGQSGDYEKLYKILH